MRAEEVSVLLLAEVMDKVWECFWPGVTFGTTLAAVPALIALLLGRFAPRVLAWGALLPATLFGLLLLGGAADEITQCAWVEAGWVGAAADLAPCLPCALAPGLGLIMGLGLRALARTSHEGRAAPSASPPS